MATIEIKHRWTGAVMFSCEASDEIAGASRSMKLGFAAKKAVAAGANMAGANLASANLADANLSDADLADANLARANLSDANLSDANLARANLADADLAGADLAGANLSDANLSDADLAGADLAGANLARADLADANLASANLAGANLSDANLARATWRNGIKITRAPIQIYGLRWPVTILDNDMEIGCQSHSLAEWDAFDDRTIIGMDGRDALKFWRVHKTTLLAIAAADGRGVVAEAV